MSKPLKHLAFATLGVGLSFALIGCQKDGKQSIPGKEGTYVHSVEEFKRALAAGANSILTSDLDFEHESITINRDLRIDSMDNESTLKNVYFNIVGPTVTNERIEVSFSNLVMDGTFDASSVNLNAEESFEEIFGSDRDGKNCIRGTSGYFSLSLSNCAIKNYASEIAPAIYVSNTDLEDYRAVTLEHCKIHDNIAYWDTIQLSHVKMQASFYDCEFYSNYAFKAAGFSITNGTAVIDRVNVHDNRFLPYDLGEANSQLCGGGVYLGGNDVRMSNSYIVNNKTVYGGGLGLATPYSGNKNVILDNVSIKNNEATYGGGVIVHSLSGQPATFLDCEILGNKAKLGGPLYAVVYGKWVSANNGGLVQFLFSTFGLNEAEDNAAFSFYERESTKGQIGTISLKGCFAIGNDAYDSQYEDYNYIATKEQALLDGVIDENAIRNVSNGLSPIAGSKADQKVPEETYHGWSDLLLDHHEERSIGNAHPVAEEKKAPIALILVVSVSGAVLLLAIIAVVIVLTRRKGTKEPKETPNEQADNRQEYILGLSPRERKVVELLIAGKKRKDIAVELNYSENTIKRDLTVIYSKLHVSDKYELMLRYKELF